MKLPDLPVYYYHDHFREMLSFVLDSYSTVLADEHHAFVTRFYDLSKDAQCLLIRMLNRRGAVFNRDHFRYAEISDVVCALEALASQGHARPLNETDYEAFLKCLPKVVAGRRQSGRSQQYSRVAVEAPSG